MAIETMPPIGHPEPEKPKHLPFETQRRRKLSMEVGSYKAKGEYIHIRPEVLSSETPLVIGPGLTENEDMYVPLLQGYYADGREVYEPRHSNRTLKVEQNGHPRAQQQKIEEIAAVMDIAATQPDGTKRKVDLVARSDGGVNAIFAALQHPDLVRNIILEGTKYTEPENAISLAFKLGDHAAKTGFKEFVTHPHQYMQHGIKVSKDYVKDVTKFAYEVNALAHSDTREALVRLGEHGIGRFGLHGTGDSIFPNEDLQKDIAAVNQGQKGKLLDGFLTVKGRHHESIYHDTKYIDALRWLTKMADNRSKSRQSGPEVQ